jgi:hypothetical protein
MSSPNKEKNKEKEKGSDSDTTWFLINCIMHSEHGRLDKV